MGERGEGAPAVDDNVIRIQLKQPGHEKWQLRTSNLSPGMAFPTIQLFDCDGNLLLETNHENVHVRRQSFRVRTKPRASEPRGKLQKHHTFHGDGSFTRIYRGSALVSANRRLGVGGEAGCPEVVLDARSEHSAGTSDLSLGTSSEGESVAFTREGDLSPCSVSLGARKELPQTSDALIERIIQRRLKMYRRSNSLMAEKKMPLCPRCEENAERTSSESVDEADHVLSRLRRRISKIKSRERRSQRGPKHLVERSSGGCDEAVALGPSGAMGSNISQHAGKGLKGRRARSSGDLFAGEAVRSESSCGPLDGDDGLAWNRSLPNHLDGNRHLADYSRYNNKCQLGSYSRFAPHSLPGGRGQRYQVVNSGSEAEPVWKLHEQGFDQGYASERSPEEEGDLPSIPPEPLLPEELQQYEEHLRTFYPFITAENSFEALVQKDGCGLGMSVSARQGLVRIRRLYAPQPAWRSGLLRAHDVLLAANGVPLAGLGTRQALQVLRTAPARVRLRVSRPAGDAPEPPAPPPPPPRSLPRDPLNCHPLHARLSQRTSSGTSSSEGPAGLPGSREGSPEAELRPELQCGEFEVVLRKVNGSLGFTLRKEEGAARGGHRVRALVREPALTDGRLLPGDRVLAANGAPLQRLQHAQAVALLRQCPAEVRLRLRRDPPPAAPAPPAQPPLRPKPPLRPEAVTMLSDLALRRQPPEGERDGELSLSLSPRKLRRLTREPPSPLPPEPPEAPAPPSPLPPAPDFPGLGAKNLSAPNVMVDVGARASGDASGPPRLRRPRSASAAPAPKGRRLKFSLTAPSRGSDLDIDAVGCAPPPPPAPPAPQRPPARSLHEHVAELQQHVQTLERHIQTHPYLQRRAPERERERESESERVLTLELQRGWSSRLGFSVALDPRSGRSVVSAVHAHSVAQRDGRLRAGDVLLQVNDLSVAHMPAKEVIDLLRLLRGAIAITVLRPAPPPPSPPAP